MASLFVALVLVGCKAKAELNSSQNFKKGVAYVLYGSIGGAILGLSTLSFYGNPQEHSGNITNGAILGCLSGLGLAFYKQTEIKSEESSPLLGFYVGPDVLSRHSIRLNLEYRF